jgi:hypothetical protein
VFRTRPYVEPSSHELAGAGQVCTPSLRGVLVQPMNFKTPRTAWPLLVAGNLAYLLLIPLYGFWIARVTRGSPSGSTAADSIGLPVDGLTTKLLLGIPVLNFLLWIVLRRYPGPVQVLQRGRLGNTRIGIAEAVFLISITGTGLLVLDSALNADWEFVGMGIAWLYILLCARAVVLARMTRTIRLPPTPDLRGRAT